MQVTRLRPRKKEDGTEKESCSRKKTLVSSTAMNQHQPHPGSPGTQPHGFGLLLISHSLDIRKHKKGLEEFHPPGGQCFTVHSFFFFFTLSARLELNIFLIHCSWIKWLLKVIHHCHFHLRFYSHTQWK